LRQQLDASCELLLRRPALKHRREDGDVRALGRDL
jgi:hypothetical protein